MKKGVIILILVLAMVSFVSAATINPYQSITGDVSIKLDEKYIQETEQGRYFRPVIDKLTPFDDIVCEIAVPAGVKETLTFKGKLITTDKNGVETIINSGDLVYDKKAMREGGIKNIYSWKIAGWTGGAGIATSNELLNKVIENKKILCEVKFEEPRMKRSLEITTSNCVHLWGSDGTVKDKDGNVIPVAKSNLIYMMGYSLPDSLNANGVIQQAQKDQGKFNDVDPFKTKKELISYYADIRGYNDYDWTLHEVEPVGEHHLGSLFHFYTDEEDETKNAYSYIYDDSCSNINSEEKVRVFYSGLITGAYTTSLGGKIIVTNSISPNPRETLRWKYVIVHEFGHTQRLYDEYNFINSKKSDYSRGMANCVKNTSEIFPRGFKLDAVFLGELNKNNNGKGCSWFKDFFIPSEGSIMNNQPDEFKFNLVSCVSLLYNLGFTMDNAAEECKTMDVIKPAA